MAHEQRIPIIKEIERIRGSHVICYLTSLRPGVPAQIADDQVRVFFDHLLELPERPLVLGGCCCAHIGAIEGLASRYGRLGLV